MTSYLVFPDLASAQNRSKAQALANGCDGVSTVYWWTVIQHPSNGQAALQIADSGPFGTVDLTAAEIAVLKTQVQLQAAGWLLGL